MRDDAHRERSGVGVALGVLHVGAMGVWAGVIVATGLSVASAFPEMRALDPALPGYSAYDGAHWMIGAGTLANRVFQMTDIAQIVVMGLAVAAFLGASVLRGRSMARVPFLAHALCLLLTAALLAAHLLWLRPAMESHLFAYWEAAAAGAHDVADTHRGAFNALHPVASRLIGGTCLAALATILCGAWSMGSAARSSRERAL